jgi:hypothetical protein
VRWQYRVVNIGSYMTADRMQTALGHLGPEGWELIGVFDKSSNWIGGTEKGFMLFKRPVAQGEHPVGSWSEVWNVDRLAAEAGSADRARVRLAPSDNAYQPGWYPDPYNDTASRWWDGETWTDEVSGA